MVKVEYSKTTEYMLMKYIEKTSSDIILREELKLLDSERQVSRALDSLVKKEKLAKIGYGIYTKLNYSTLVKRTYLPKGFISLGREALTRLGIPWEISSNETAYNEGKTQQVPVNPATKLLARFRRKITYKNMELRFE
jgi:hypothetical protein